MGWGGRGTHAAPRCLWGEPASCAAWRPRVIRASAHSWGAATPESTVGGRGSTSWALGHWSPCACRACVRRVLCSLGTAGGPQELLAGFSLLGELEEEEDEDEEKVTPVRPGGLVAVFCPVRLFRQTGQLSCCVGTEWEKGAVQNLVGRGGPVTVAARSPAPARAQYSRRGTGGCTAAAARARPARSRPCTRGTPARSL